MDIYVHTKKYYFNEKGEIEKSVVTLSDDENTEYWLIKRDEDIVMRYIVNDKYGEAITISDFVAYFPVDTNMIEITDIISESPKKYLKQVYTGFGNTDIENFRKTLGSK